MAGRLALGLAIVLAAVASAQKLEDTAKSACTAIIDDFTAPTNPGGGKADAEWSIETFTVDTANGQVVAKPWSANQGYFYVTTRGNGCANFQAYSHLEIVVAAPGNFRVSLRNGNVDCSWSSTPLSNAVNANAYADVTGYALRTVRIPLSHFGGATTDRIWAVQVNFEVNAVHYFHSFSLFGEFCYDQQLSSMKVGYIVNQDPQRCRRLILDDFNNGQSNSLSLPVSASGMNQFSLANEGLPGVRVVAPGGSGSVFSETLGSCLNGGIYEFLEITQQRPASSANNYNALLYESQTCNVPGASTNLGSLTAGQRVFADSRAEVVLFKYNSGIDYSKLNLLQLTGFTFTYPFSFYRIALVNSFCHPQTAPKTTSTTLGTSTTLRTSTTLGTSTSK